MAPLRTSRTETNGVPGWVCSTTLEHGQGQRVGRPRASGVAPLLRDPRHQHDVRWHGHAVAVFDTMTMQEVLLVAVISRCMGY